MAEGCISDYATAVEGDGEAPSFAEWAFRHNKPGFCSLCQEQITSAVDVQMINDHLELGQLWQCTVEWCTVWKGSVSDCLGHLLDMHGCSQFFPLWMVPRDLWMTALRLDVSGIAVGAPLFTRPGAIWYTSNHFHIRRSGGGGGGECFLG